MRCCTLIHSTLKPRFNVPQITGSFDLLGPNSLPRKQTSYVNRCKFYPDLPSDSIYRA